MRAADELYHDLADEVGRGIADEDVRSVLLFGSAARGEATVGPGGELISDLEYIVTLRRYSRRRKRRVQGHLRRISREIAEREKSPRFSAYASIRPYSLLWAYPRNIRLFEIQAHSRVVTGEDIRGRLPGVDIDSLNLGSVRSLILVRLIHQLRDLLAEARDSFHIRYSLARNYLDLATILLPHQGVLAAGYRERLEVLRADPERLQGVLDFDFLERCTTTKLAYTPEPLAAWSTRELVETFTAATRELVSWLVSDYLPTASPGGVPRPLTWRRPERLRDRTDQLLSGYDDIRGRVRWLLLPLRQPQAGFRLRHVDLLEALLELIEWSWDPQPLSPATVKVVRRFVTGDAGDQRLAVQEMTDTLLKVY